MKTDLREALAPLSSSLNRNRMFARPVSQVTVRLIEGNADFAAARDEVLRWMQARAGRRLPEAAWNGESFEIEDIGAQHAEAVALEEANYWAARLDDADREMPGRTWSTEVGLAPHADGHAILGVRLTVTTRGQDAQPHPSVPGFLRQIVDNVGCVVDGRRLSATPWLVQTRSDVATLVRLIEDTRRRREVIVLSLPEGSTDVTDTACSAERVCRATLGAAHIAVITGPAAFFLSDIFGKEFSVFHQAVRSYRPGFNRDLDPLHAHPLSFPARIAAWPDGGPAGFENFLVAGTLGRTVSGRELERDVPSFVAVKRAAAALRVERSRESGSSDREMVELLEEENRELKRLLEVQAKEGADLASLFSSDADAAREAADQERATNRALRARIDHLTSRLAALPGGEVANVPHTLEGFETWCAANLAGRVELHSRAFQGIKRSRFDDVPLIYDALILLRDFYVPMRLNGGKDGVDRFRKRCAALGLDEQPTGTKVAAGHQGDEYYIRQGGRRCFLARHLKKGSARDERLCFRLYFFWDDEAEQVVVGWLPSHLDSRIT